MREEPFHGCGASGWSSGVLEAAGDAAGAVTVPHGGSDGGLEAFGVEPFRGQAGSGAGYLDSTGYLELVASERHCAHGNAE